MNISRRAYISSGSSAACGVLAATRAISADGPSFPRGKLTITRVRAVEVRKVPTGRGLVLPWDPKKTPQDTRDYVVVQFFTNEGIIGTTMVGDYTLPAGIAQTVQELAEAYFVGKDPFDIELHAESFFAQAKARVRLFFLEIGL